MVLIYCALCVALGFFAGKFIFVKKSVTSTTKSKNTEISRPEIAEAYKILMSKDNY